jgi:hypothetical protein
LIARHHRWLAAVALVWAGCARAPSPAELGAQFDEAERLCLDGKFDEANVVLKRYLMHRPEDAGAHYYLGRTFMLSKDFRPMLAEGEFQTALRLFQRQGRESPIERFDPAYFEMMCNIDSAKVLYLQCVTVASLGATPNTFEPILGRALGYIDRAQSIMPGAAEVEQVGGPIRELAADIGVADV